jgi:hypothetical protein
MHVLGAGNALADVPVVVVRLRDLSFDHLKAGVFRADSARTLRNICWSAAKTLQTAGPANARLFAPLYLKKLTSSAGFGRGWPRKSGRKMYRKSVLQSGPGGARAVSGGRVQDCNLAAHRCL